MTNSSRHNIQNDRGQRPIPMLDLKGQHEPIRKELDEALLGVMEHGQFVLGTETNQFEEAVRSYLNVPHAFGVSSGTDALLLALMAAGIGPGDEVLLPAFTFFATAGSVVRCGATPVFCDIEPDTYNIDPEDVKKRITQNTRALLPVHIFGQTADMIALKELADQHDLIIIEDAAQALGAAHKRIPAGRLGDLAAFSFYPTKNLGACGDAGLLTSINDKLANQVRILRVHGMEPKYCHHEVGGNFRIDGFQSAILRVKLNYLEGWNAGRTQAAEYYEKTLMKIEGTGISTQISKNSSPKLILPGVRKDNHVIWHQYTVRIPGKGRRDALLQYLRDHKIGCDIFYPMTLDQQPCFRYLKQGDDLAVAHQVAADCLSLPMHPHLKCEAIEYIASIISCFFESH